MSLLYQLLKVGYLHVPSDKVHKIIIDFLHKHESTYYYEYEYFVADFVKVDYHLGKKYGGWVGYIRSKNHILVLNEKVSNLYVNDDRLTKELAKCLHSDDDNINICDIYTDTDTGIPSLRYMHELPRIIVPQNKSLIERLAKVKDIKIDSDEVASVIIKHMYRLEVFNNVKHYHCEDVLVMHLHSMNNVSFITLDFIHNYKIIIMFCFHYNISRNVKVFDFSNELVSELTSEIGGLINAVFLKEGIPIDIDNLTIASLITKKHY